MLSQEIRKKFLEFFKSRGHTLVPSSPVVPHDDPTLLFINAGMNQFKDVFLGESRRDYTKATSSQKCVRAGGKHNDLENVGHTTRHLTFFEMLGNFSFGDYFKKEAIDLAWEATLNAIEFPVESLWATVFYEDDEAFELWKRHLPEERIVRMGEKDNFWAMGDTGPCGPCSELFFDRGEKYGAARSPAEDIDGERYLEFWNLVFMEFNRDASGKLTPLPNKSVDTGAGLERIVSLKMEVDSLFETDILMELIAEVESVSGQKYDPAAKNAAAFRVIADHLRCLSFAIADGVQPSNLDRGYVLRKILRRAVRYGRQLGMEEPFLSKVLPRLITTMGDDYPELVGAKDRIEEILTLEEEGFLRTLKRGGNILGQIIADSKEEISGDDAFKLKDTYGLPLEEILLIAKDADLTVDIARFETLEHEARERSRERRKGTEQIASETVYANFPSTFVGFTQLTGDGVVIGLFKEGKEVDALHEGEEGIVLLDKTPFYAEKGGQVGDQGVLTTETSRFAVFDTQSPYTDVVAHQGVLKKGELRVGQTVSATVDRARRQKIGNNHTATHLLHWALQHVFGEHVRQAGSVVEPDRLRFDFSHHKAPTQEELERVEDLVNAKIRENRHVQTYEMSFDEAQKHKEIKQFFGEKYGASVRVVDIEFSKELCGGTHTEAVGNIGYFKIAKESSIAAGVRRIEAVTGPEAEILARDAEKSMADLGELLKAQPHQIVERIEKLLEEKKGLEDENKRLKKKEFEELVEHIEMIGTVPTLIREVIFSPKELKECADTLMNLRSPLLLFLLAQSGERCTLLVRASSDVGIRADQLLKEVAPVVGGKGGGKADSAQGGGTEPAKIPEAIEKAKAWIATQCP